MTIDSHQVAADTNRDLPGDQDRCSSDGIALLAGGRFQDALAPLRMALQLGDTRASTTLNLAIAEDHTGSRDHARRLMRHVADQCPDWDEPIVRLAESLRAAGETAAAERAYRRVLELNPRRTEALIALSGLLLMRKQAAEARTLLLDCCAVAPDNAEAWNTLGLAFKMTGEPGQALTAFVHAQRLQPDRVDYAVNGARIAIEAEQADAELVRLALACDQNPLNIALQVGRGILLELTGHESEAIDALEAASELAPDELVPLTLLSNVLAHSNRTPRAEVVLRRVLAQTPDDQQVGNALAVVLMRLQRHAEANAILRDVLDRHGPDSSVLSNMANVTSCLGSQDEAVEMARSAIRQNPDAVLPRRALCNTLPYQEGVTGASMLSAMRDCSERLPRSEQPPFTNTVDPDRPLVVGLLSGSLQTHPVGWLTVAGFENLDPEQFSLICLAQETMLNDVIARRFRSTATEWLEVGYLTDAALLKVARERNIDILIDLGGHGHAARMAACANRLAPVQIKWVGMQSHSSGLAEMDWFLTDRWETPDGFEPFYSEKLLRMPDGYVCYSPPPLSPDVVALPALTNGFVTFGCFNNIAKITPRVIATWAEILRRIPNARLILKTHQFTDAAIADRYRSEFAALGVTGDRVEMRGASPHRLFMGQYGDVDLVLDPFPYSGGLTTCEALWMGVPTITLPGETFASRHSASHMSNAGLPDWITGSVQEYIEMTVTRAANIPALAKLRAGLREQTRTSPLCDAPKFGQNLGVALRHTWKTWCKEQSLMT